MCWVHLYMNLLIIFIIFFQPSDGDATLSLSPPFKSSDFSINFVGGDLELQTAFGLTIACGSSGSVKIRLPPDYAGQVEGLCGDFDGDKNNDGNVTLFDPGNFVSKQYFVPDVENPSDVWVDENSKIFWAFILLLIVIHYLLFRLLKLL